MERWMIWVLIAAVSLVGSCGNILWKIASNHIGQISWDKLFDLQWSLRTLFSPLVFTALFLMFVGRFASMVPTGYMGITELIMAITIMTLIFTAVLDTLFLKTSYPLEVWIGIAIGIVSIYLISRSVG